MKNILLIPGDGIGPEVVLQAVKILKVVERKFGISFNFTEALLGGIAYDNTGTPFPKETLDLAKKSDAILLGAVGGPKWESLDYSVRPERGLLGIRKELELFANLRPAVVFDSLLSASTVKPEVIQGLDILIVRELTGGIYFGSPRGVETLPDGTKRGFNTEVYTTHEIERIAHVAFDLASKRGKKLCSIDKANVLECTELWRDVVTSVSKNYPDVLLSHMYVDNAAMQLVRNPRQFDVVLTSNLFGDILSDEAAMLTGSLGMLPSASIGAKNGDKQYALYEPIHGSAPDIAGKGIANPIATISSAAMMLKYSFNMELAAKAVDMAISHALKNGFRTADIAESVGNIKIVGTAEMGDVIASFI